MTWLLSLRHLKLTRGLIGTQFQMLLNYTRLNKYIFKEWLLSGHYVWWGYILKLTFGSSTIFYSLLQHHIFFKKKKPLKTYLLFHTCMPASSVPRLFCCGNDMTSLRHFQLRRGLIATSICNAFCLFSLICTLTHPHSCLQIISPIYVFLFRFVNQSLIRRTCVSKGMELPIGV